MVYRLVLVSFLTVAVMLPLLWAAFAPYGARGMLESAGVPPTADATQEVDVQRAPADELLPNSGSASGEPAASPMIVATPEQTPPPPPAAAIEAPAVDIEPPVRPEKDEKTEGRQPPGQDVDPTVSLAPPPFVQPLDTGDVAGLVASERLSSNVEQPVAALAPPEAGIGAGQAVVDPPEPSIGESADGTMSATPAPANRMAEPRMVKSSRSVRNKARRVGKRNSAARTSYRRDRRDGGWIAIMRDAKWLRD